MENGRNVSPVSAHGFNNEKPPCESRVASLSKKQYFIFMLRAAARIQSNLLCKFINSGSMVQTTLSCRYAAIHLVYLGIYTREEKMCPSGRGFSSVFARKRGFEREAARKTLVFRQPQATQPQRHTFRCASFHFPQIFFLQALTGYHAHPRQIFSSMAGVICVSIARIRS